MKEVPADKVISAIPFFTRLWKESSGSIDSDALGMDDAKATVDAAGAQAAWDETTKQNYATWKGSDGTKYEIWLEDADSLEPKLELMKKNKLAGTAEWALGLENQDIWTLIQKYTK